MNKLKNSIFKILIELFIFDKVKRSKIKARWAKRYLKKYLDVQVKEQLSTDQNHLPLWSYWHQGKENAPELVQRCFESVQKYEGNRKINILSFDTIKDYVELPQRYYDLVSSGKMPVALFSDILRMYLLTQYGGVWIDSTIMLTKYRRRLSTRVFAWSEKTLKKTIRKTKCPVILSVQIRTALI